MYEDVIGVLERFVDDTGKVCLTIEEIETLVNEALEAYYAQGSSRVVSEWEMNGVRPQKRLGMIDEASFHAAGLARSLEDLKRAMSVIWDLADSLLKEYDNCEGVLANADADFFYETIRDIQEQAEE